MDVAKKYMQKSRDLYPALAVMKKYELAVTLNLKGKCLNALFAILKFTFSRQEKLPAGAAKSHSG